MSCKCGKSLSDMVIYGRRSSGPNRNLLDWSVMAIDCSCLLLVVRDHQINNVGAALHARDYWSFVRTPVHGPQQEGRARFPNLRMPSEPPRKYLDSLHSTERREAIKVAAGGSWPTAEDAQ